MQTASFAIINNSSYWFSVIVNHSYPLDEQLSRLARQGQVPTHTNKNHLVSYPLLLTLQSWLASQPPFSAVRETWEKQSLSICSSRSELAFVLKPNVWENTWGDVFCFWAWLPRWNHPTFCSQLSHGGGQIQLGGSDRQECDLLGGLGL